MLLPFISVFLLVILDQTTKFYASLHLQNVHPVTVIPGILQLTYVENKGAAFGILQGQIWLFVIVTLLLCVGIIYYYTILPKNKESIPLKISLILILAGAIGNFIDRVLNQFVVDFLQIIFIHWPVFNVADMYVISGTALLAVLLLLPEKEEKNENGRD